MIDAHVHCFSPQLASRALHAAASTGEFFVNGTIDDQLALARREGVRKIVLLNFASRPETMADVNRFAIENNGKDGAVISLGTVHPFAENAEEELMRLFACGIRGIKFQPVRQAFSMDDPRCRKLFTLIGKLKMITVIHGGRSARTKAFPVLPEHIEKCIDCFQGSPVVLSHMGGMFLSRAEIDRAAALPVVTDTAYSAHHMDQATFTYAFEKFGVDRVLFGTDLPWANFAKERAFVDSLSLSSDEQERVFDRNAMRILKTCGAWDE